MSEGSDAVSILAIWGAVVSTVALGWNVFTALRDKGKLLVQASVVKQAGDASEKHFLLVTVINVGRRPIYVEQVGGKWRMPVDGMPNFYMLSLNLQMKEADLWRQAFEFKVEQHGNIVNLDVHGAGGETFRMGWLNRRSLMKQIDAAVAEIKAKPI